MRLGPCSAALEEPAPPLLFDPLRTFSEWQHRADVLGVQMATLRRLIARNFVLNDVNEPFDADRSERGTILVALNHPALQSIAAAILEEVGYRVVIMDRQMADVPGGFAIDAVLLDVPLVDEKCLACVRLARQMAPRVVVVTSVPEGSGRQRLREIGVASFLAWPLDSGEVAACFRRVLKSDPARIPTNL